MDCTYSTFSLVGFVSSKRKWQIPPGCSSAMPKFKQIDLAWPMCRYPFGSGGKRVTTRPARLPVSMSRATMARMKSEGVVESLAIGISVNLERPVLLTHQASKEKSHLPRD